MDSDNPQGDQEGVRNLQVQVLVLRTCYPPTPFDGGAACCGGRAACCAPCRFKPSPIESLVEIVLDLFSPCCASRVIPGKITDGLSWWARIGLWEKIVKDIQQAHWLPGLSGDISGRILGAQR
ncbi:MAG: hypothetical protein Kow0099_13320 [Candidatus Abyssubacteria bacterium]